MMLRFSVSATCSLLTAALLGLFFASACKSPQQAQSGSEHSTSVDRTKLERLYWERVERSRLNFTAADVTFMQDMIVHHAQALIMSELAPQNNAGDEVRRLAARIHAAQRDEIALMQQWLRERGQAVPEIGIDGIDLTVRTPGHLHRHDHSDMPGMLTRRQLEELRDARESKFDRLFLVYMIEHHEGAITMVDGLLGTDGAAQGLEVFRLAADIHAEQVTEINRMRIMLEAMGGG